MLSSSMHFDSTSRDMKKQVCFPFDELYPRLLDPGGDGDSGAPFNFERNVAGVCIVTGLEYNGLQ